MDPEDETRYVGYEIWVSQDALDRHAAKPHTQHFLEVVKELVAEPARPLAASRWVPMRTEAPARYAVSSNAAVKPPPWLCPQTFTTSDEAELHFVMGGSGRTILLLHGFPNSWYAWRDVMPALASTYRVIAADLRGLGDSTAGSLPTDVPTGAADVHELVAHLECQMVSVIGQDWGGSTAFAYAAAYQTRFLTLVYSRPFLVGPGAIPDAARTDHGLPISTRSPTCPRPYRRQ